MNEITSVFYISSILLMANMVCFCVSNFRKTKKDIVFWHMCCSICDFFMYLVLGAKTGLANATANLCKNVAYAKLDSMFFTILFSLFRMILLVIGYEGISTFLFILLEIISLFILKYGTAPHFRILSAIRQAVWIVYDWMYATVVVVFFTSIGFLSCVIAVMENSALYKVFVRRKSR